MPTCESGTAQSEEITADVMGYQARDYNSGDGKAAIADDRWRKVLGQGCVFSLCEGVNGGLSVRGWFGKVHSDSVIEGVSQTLMPRTVIIECAMVGGGAD